MNEPTPRTAGEPLVSVYCMTYNQEKTIAQAIEGVLAQQTNFPFELIVHDDASTDGTAEIVRTYAKKYPGIIRAIFQEENQYHRYNLIHQFIHPLSRGQLIAFCEGDDFWDDPQKLQIQADYMRRHSECTLCFHAVRQIAPDGTEAGVRPCKKDGVVPGDRIIKRGGLFCATVSLMFRRSVLDCWPEFREMADVYDYPLQALAVSMGQAYYIDRFMAAYRFASSGSWTQQHAGTVDYEHIENETAWLSAFNDYTEKKYDYAVNYHMAHMWFTEYRKERKPSLKRNARIYMEKLSFSDRFVFSSLFLFFSLFGSAAEKIFGIIKKIILK